MTTPIPSSFTPIYPRGVLKQDYRTIIEIHDQIMSCLNQPMPTIEQLAAQATMSPTKFRELFKKMYGSSIYQYHLVARLTLGKELLMENEYTITQISYKVGFAHPPAFIKAFRIHFQTLPSTFRVQAFDNRDSSYGQLSA
jgi:AraC-like DNA-binding protein